MTFQEEMQRACIFPAAPVSYGLCETNKTIREVTSMKRTRVKFAILMALVLGVYTANAAYAEDGHGGGHDNEVKFTGTIASLPGSSDFTGDWSVAGRTVHVTAATHIEQEHGQIAVGATVKVEGTQRADGSVDATEINVKNSPAGPGGG